MTDRKKLMGSSGVTPDNKNGAPVFISMFVENRRLRVDLGSRVAWLEFDKAGALAFAQAIIKEAESL